VKLRLVSDVPLGAFLSGGVIQASSSGSWRNSAGEGQGLFVGFEEEGDELAYARVGLKPFCN